MAQTETPRLTDKTFLNYQHYNRAHKEALCRSVFDEFSGQNFTKATTKRKALVSEFLCETALEVSPDLLADLLLDDLPGHDAVVQTTITNRLAFVTPTEKDIFGQRLMALSASRHLSWEHNALALDTAVDHGVHLTDYKQATEFYRRLADKEAAAHKKGHDFLKNAGGDWNDALRAMIPELTAVIGEKDPRIDLVTNFAETSVRIGSDTRYLAESQIKYIQQVTPPMVGHMSPNELRQQRTSHRTQLALLEVISR